MVTLLSPFVGRRGGRVSAIILSFPASNDAYGGAAQSSKEIQLGGNVVPGKRKNVLVCAAVGLLLIAQVGAASAAPEPQSCQFTKQIPVQDLQYDQFVGCDLTGAPILFDGGRAMATPAAGEVVSGMPSSVVGSEGLDKLSVANLGPDLGVVGFTENDAHEVTYWGPADAVAIVKEQEAKAKGSDEAEIALASLTDPCSDSSRTNMGTQWANGYYWWYNHNASPNGLFPGVERGGWLMAEGYNSCGLDMNQISTNSTYMGSAGSGANIYFDATCAPRDNINTVNFGGLKSGTLAVACWWYSLWTYSNIEADIAFNSNYWWHAGTTGCPANHFQLDDISAHEFGHSFGLGHVSELSGNVMRERTSPCTSIGGIGYGDWYMMQGKY